jgi:hypothetical protein
MRRYRIVQIGPNAQLVGVKEGLIRVGNQSRTPCRVKNEPTAPAVKGINIEIINLNASLLPSGDNDSSKIIFHFPCYELQCSCIDAILFYHRTYQKKYHFKTKFALYCSANR